MYLSLGELAGALLLAVAEQLDNAALIGGEAGDLGVRLPGRQDDLKRIDGHEIDQGGVRSCCCVQHDS